MSDSPKYCVARLREEQERRLREERERQAALGRARREAEESRRRSERLERNRQAVFVDFSGVRQAFHKFYEADLVQFLPQQRLKALDEELRRAQDSITREQNEDSLQRIALRIRVLNDDLRRLVTDAHTAKLCADLAVEEASLVALEQQLAALDRRRSDKFDPLGIQEVSQLIARARNHLRQQSLSDVRRDAAEASQSLERHLIEVAERHSLWQQAKERAETMVAAARDRLDGLGADDVVSRWTNVELIALQERLASAAALLEREGFDEACTECAAISTEGDRIFSMAQELQLKEDRRNYIVAGICDVMQQMGFFLQQDPPTLEHPNLPTSATIIQAVRLGGGSLGVSVPHDGQIWYQVGGFPLREETTIQGQSIRTCDEAEEEIERMHRTLQDNFGIEMSELMWNGKPLDRKVDKVPHRGSTSGPRTRGR